MTPTEPALPSPSSAAPVSGSGRWDLSYRAKLVLGVCGLVLLTGAAITWLADRSARGNTEALIDSLFREVSGHAVTHTRAFVLRAGPLVQSMQNLGDKGLALDDSDRLAGQLLAFLKGNPGLSWVSYGDEAGTFTGAQRTPEGGLRINQSRIVGGHTRLFLFTADGTLLAPPHQPRTTAAGQGDAGKLLTLADAGDPLVDAFRQNLRPEHVRPGTGEAFHFLTFRQEGTDYLASA